MVTLALYGHPFSSYTWKALIALYANATPFEFREIDPSVPKFESFTGKAHPSGQFPVLTDGETVVVETSSIVEYLAVHHPGPAPLIPADPADAVRSRSSMAPTRAARSAPPPGSSGNVPRESRSSASRSRAPRPSCN